jgi:type IV pilus assembly protein PilM
VSDESIWKKEISFKRKPKEEGEAPKSPEASGDEPTSVWKKEISLKRKPKPAPEPEVEEDKDAVWQQQIEQAAEEIRQSAPPEPQPEPVAAEPSPDQTVWKKEVSFSRKPAPAPEVTAEAEALAPPDPEPVPAEPVSAGPVAVPDPEPNPEETVWKKEVSFSRKPEPAPEVTAEAEAAAPPDPEPVPAEPVSTGPVAVPDPGPGPEETVWTKEVSFSRKPEPEEVPAPAPAPAAAAEPQPEPPPQPEVPPAAVEPVVTVDEDTARRASLLASFSRPPGAEPPPVEAPTVEVAPAPAPVAEAAPAPVAEVPAPKVEQKNVPFWKKDISFGGKKKEPKEPKAPKQPKQKKEKAPKEPRVKEPKAPKVKAEKGSKGAKRLVGLKIGASQLAAARVANNGSAELLQVAREPLMPGIVVGGELRDPDALAEALKDFFAKHKLPKKGVRLGIANNRIGVRTFEIGGIADPKQLGNAIRFRAQEVLPIPIDEAVLDYQVLGEGVDEHGQPTRRVLLVVAYRELIDRYVDACKKAGVTLSGIDLEAFALLRALQAPQEGVGGDPTAALVAVAIGHERSTFAVSDGRVCEFTRVLEWGGASLNVAIARALNSAPSEVEDVKHVLSLTNGAIPSGLDPEQARRAVDAVRKAIQTFARELVSSLQYYQNQPGSLGIAEIVLSGGTAHLPGLAAELEALIGVRVRVGDPLARMKVSKRVGEPAQVGSLAVAIGLGIED